MRSAYQHQVLDHDGVSVFRTRETRPERAPPLSRNRRCSRGPGAIPGPPPAASQRHGSVPRRCRHLSGATTSRDIRRGFLTSPARPSPRPWPPGDTRAPPASPRAPHPHGQDPRTHAGTGTGSEHKPGTTPLAYMPALQSASSLASCATSRRTCIRRCGRPGARPACGRRRITCRDVGKLLSCLR